MNRSYNKIRHIQKINVLLEQKYINEQMENQGILNLYEDRVKKQYLLGEQNDSDLSTILKGSHEVSLIGERGINAKIRKFCNAYKAEATLDDYDIKKIINDMQNATKKYRNLLTFTGRGLKDDAVTIFKQKIQELEYVSNFCRAVNLSKDMGLEDGDILNMFDEIIFANSFGEILHKINRLSFGKKEDQCIGWENYTCVTESRSNLKPIKLTSPTKYKDTVVYEGSGYYWFHDGQRFNLTTKKYEYYFCSYDIVEPGLDPSPKCKTKKEEPKPEQKPEPKPEQKKEESSTSTGINKNLISSEDNDYVYVKSGLGDSWEYKFNKEKGMWETLNPTTKQWILIDPSKSENLKKANDAIVKIYGKL